MPYADPARQREYQNNWMQQRRQAWLSEHGPCVDCGTWDDLEIDHRDASQKVTHRIWSWSTDRRAAELAKCVVRCFPCHRIKTKLSGELRPAHGERQYKARLTADSVREIRRLFASGATNKTLAAQFGVNGGTITCVLQRRTWKHIDG